eukprot:5363763-Karenia_brevis.AAC.1
MSRTQLVQGQGQPLATTSKPPWLLNGNTIFVSGFDGTAIKSGRPKIMSAYKVDEFRQHPP